MADGEVSHEGLQWAEEEKAKLRLLLSLEMQYGFLQKRYLTTVALSKSALRIGCFSILGLIAIPIILMGSFILYDFLEPESWKEKESANEFVDMVISPRPSTMVYYRTLDYGEGTLSGDAAYCTAAYTLRPDDFELILKAHKWVSPHFISAERSFRLAWPDYTGEIENYYYDEGAKGAATASGYSIVAAVSADHTKLVFSAVDEWERPFDSEESKKQDW